MSTRSSGSAAAGSTTARHDSICPVCNGRLKAGMMKVYVWRPPAAEIEKYKSASCHAGCRQKLIAGARPPGVVRHGLSPQQAFLVVQECEQLRTGRYDDNSQPITWSAYQPDPDADPLRPPLKRDLRAARLRHAEQLEKLTEVTGSEAHRKGRQHLHTFDNLQLVVDYLQRHEFSITDPRDLMETLRDLSQRKKLHHLDPPGDGIDWDYQLL